MKYNDHDHTVTPRKCSPGQICAACKEGAYLVRSIRKIMPRDLQFAYSKSCGTGSDELNYHGRGELSKCLTGRIDEVSSGVLVRLSKDHSSRQNILEHVAINPTSHLPNYS